MSRVLKLNEVPMQNVHYKLSKEFERLSKMSDWLKKKDELGGEIGETLTLGSEENISALAKSSIIPLAPLALGVASLVAGLVVAFPLVGGPGTTNAEIEFLKDVKNATEKVFEFSGGSFKVGFALSSIPLGIATISLPKKVLRMIKDKVDKKTKPIMIEDDKILTMIEDILEGKENDQSLELPAAFLRKVDIRGNPESFNKDLLSYLAYFRFCVQENELGYKKEEDVKEAFKMLTDFLEESKHKLTIPKDFKDNKFVNLLINESKQDEEDLHTGINK